MTDSQSGSKTRVSKKPRRPSRATSVKTAAKTVSKTRSALRASTTPTKRRKSSTTLAEQPDGQFAENAALNRPRMTFLEHRRQIIIGPLPPPEILAEYEQIKEGMIDRLLIRMEKEQSHRQGIEDLPIFGQGKT